MEITNSQEEIYEPIKVLFRAVANLHKQGYEQLRVFPSMSPSGMYYRLTLAPKKYFSRDGLVVNKVHDGLILYYSDSQGRKYFGWDIPENLSSEQVAEEIIKRNPDLIADSNKEDKEYVLWFQNVMEKVEQNIFPIAMDDYFLASEAAYLETTDRSVTILLPPFSC